MNRKITTSINTNSKRKLKLKTAILIIWLQNILFLTSWLHETSWPGPGCNPGWKVNPSHVITIHFLKAFLLNGRLKWTRRFGLARFNTSHKSEWDNNLHSPMHFDYFISYYYFNYLFNNSFAVTCTLVYIWKTKIKMIERIIVFCYPVVTKTVRCYSLSKLHYPLVPPHFIVFLLQNSLYNVCMIFHFSKSFT